MKNNACSDMRIRLSTNLISIYRIAALLMLLGDANFVNGNGIRVDIKRPVIPVLTHKNINPVIRLDIKNSVNRSFDIGGINISFDGSTDGKDIVLVGICQSDKNGLIDTSKILSRQVVSAPNIILKDKIQVPGDSISLWVFIKLKDKIDLTNRIHVRCTDIFTNEGKTRIEDADKRKWLRPGVAVRQKGQDGINTSRIPGLTISKDGVLLAIYDARWDSSRDLQGNIDIALQRSFDKGITWQPLQILLDMKEWGGLPQNFNGVSDACILTDDLSGDIYVLGLWMHGILDKETGRWVEGLTEHSSEWSHQWLGKGSQAGTDIKQTSQILLTKSSDNGATWGPPCNITEQVKRNEWWLLAPAPGHGITLRDGTLVFPSQGRDEQGLPFSNILWSKDHGKTWTASNHAYSDVTECMAVELADGSVMLNMRDNRNKKNKEQNGRRICITTDLGNTWEEHPASRKALIEPVCMGSIHRHTYIKKGKETNVLLFSNPNSKVRRDHITVKVSLDEGMTWPRKYYLLLDEYRGRGYSCITSIDESTIGILYESSQADMVFQQIKLNELLHE